MELGHLLTRSGLTYQEVSSKVYHDSLCQLGNSISLAWVIYFEAFYLHVLSSFCCIPVNCPKLVLFLNFNHWKVSRKEAGLRLNTVNISFSGHLTFVNFEAYSFRDLLPLTFFADVIPMDVKCTGYLETSANVSRAMQLHKILHDTTVNTQILRVNREKPTRCN